MKYPSPKSVAAMKQYFIFAEGM